MKINNFEKIILTSALALTSNLNAQENLDWSGPFVGLNVGYTWTTDEKNNASRDGFSYHAENKDNGGLIGINTGYNFMLNEKWVLGLIGEYKTYDAQDSDVDLKDGVPDDVTTVSSVESIRPCFLVADSSIRNFAIPDSIAFVIPPTASISLIISIASSAN